jgi:hypothetical protein
MKYVPNGPAVQPIVHAAAHTGIPVGEDGSAGQARTGGYVLVWVAGNATSGLPVHGWVHGRRYHQLAPALPPSYPGGWIQMTW